MLYFTLRFDSKSSFIGSYMNTIYRYDFLRVYFLVHLVYMK